MKRWTVLSAIVLASLVLAACAAPATPAPAPAEPVVEPTAMPEAAPSIVELAVSSGSFPTLVGALQATGLVEALEGEGPFTVFAPTEEAFAALPAGTLESLTTEQLADILLYHVVAGKVMAADVVGLDGQMVDTLLEGKQVAVSVEDGKVMINDAAVVTTDLEGSNGVIHVIDSVLLPPADEMADEATGSTIADIAAGDSRFSTLVGALVSAGLVDALKGEGPFTVFAPTDDAFAALPAGTLESLTVEQLTDILLYHVVPAKAMAADVVTLDGQTVDTLLEGKGITIKIDDGKVILNDSVEVVITDIEAANGVIHVVSAVLLPPAE
jgi:transforming growth factor-beta-induced protein